MLVELSDQVGGGDAFMQIMRRADWLQLLSIHTGGRPA